MFQTRKAASGVSRVAARTKGNVRDIIRAINDVARNGNRFTSKEVRQLLDQRNVVIENRNNIGTAFNVASKLGMVTMVGAVKSGVPSAHSRLVREWIAA